MITALMVHLASEASTKAEQDPCFLVTVGDLKADGRWQRFNEIMQRDHLTKHDCHLWSDSLTLRINPKLSRALGYTPER